MVGIAISVAIFLVAAALTLYRGGDPISMSALFILGGQVVKIITDWYSRKEVRDAAIVAAKAAEVAVAVAAATREAAAHAVKAAERVAEVAVIAAAAAKKVEAVAKYVAIETKDTLVEKIEENTKFTKQVSMDLADMKDSAELSGMEKAEKLKKELADRGMSYTLEEIVHFLDLREKLKQTRNMGGARTRRGVHSYGRLDRRGVRASTNPPPLFSWIQRSGVIPSSRRWPLSL